MKKILLFAFISILSLNLSAQNNFSYNVKFRNHTTFPGQTLANICGYWQKGKEYALLGASKGMIVMDVTQPDSAKQIVQIPGPNNLWKEIKVYKQYAYVTSEGGQGLQIVDLSALPSATLTNKFYKGDGAIAGKLNAIHALHIDTLKGVVYLFGASGAVSNGAIMLDIKTDPMNPKYLGAVTNGAGNNAYIHDGFAHNDTLFAGHIYRGEMEVYYTGDKTKFVSLGKVQTPTKFTHNIWLSENHKFAYTTDENNNSVLAAYDVSDLSNIKLVDKIATNPNSGAVVHNTHILNDYAVSSYYTEGFTIVDAHRPDNLVEVGRYDTYDPAINQADPFFGAWGVYPYFPSGTIVVSNIDEGLYVFTPTYLRACYLEGTTKDKNTKALLSNVSVKINKYVTANALSTLKGEYKTGISDTGLVSVTFMKAGYKALATTAKVYRGKVTILDVLLEPTSNFSFSAKVIDAATNKPIQGATVSLVSGKQTQTQLTNSNGDIGISTFADTFSVYAGKWGYDIVEEKTVQFNQAISKTYMLKKGYKDDFVSAMKLGWTTANTSPTGLWEIGVPIATNFNGQATTPDADNKKDVGQECFLTGNEAGSPGASDVDDGDVTLTSPVMDLTTYKNPGFNFDFWFFNGGGSGVMNDSLYMIIDNGTVKQKVLISKAPNQSTWQIFGKSLKAMNVKPTANTRVSFIAVDTAPGHLVKAAIDVFEVVEYPNIDVADLDENIVFGIAPNPFNTSINVDYQTLSDEKSTLIVTDISGKILEKINLDASKGQVRLGENLLSGVYFVQIQQNNKVSLTKKIVKL